MKSTSIIFIIVTMLAIAGCTIEKRLFQPGYSIEWKKKIPQKDANETASKFSDSKENADSIAHTSSSNYALLEKNKPLPLSGEENSPVPELTKNNSEVPTKTQEPIISYRNESHEIDPVLSQKKAIDIIEAEDKKEFELFGIMSFGLYFSSLALAIAGIVLLTSPYFFVAAGFMILLSLIFGIISVDKYRRDKAKYRRNFFGYFGMIASLATITFVLGLVAFAWGLDSF